jgi:hypothetical protein
MMTRRQLLSTAIAGSAAFVGGATLVGIPAAQALTEQPMPPAVAADYLAGCTATNVAGHSDLIAKARALLTGEIASGAKPTGAEAVVTCPICGCRMVVTASN